MKRRLLATFLSLCLLVGLLPTVALAADADEEQAPVCAQLDGCVDGVHATDCPLYVEPTDDTLQEQEQEEPAAQPVTSNELTNSVGETTITDATVSTEEDLRSAITSATGTEENPTIITISSDIALSSPLSIDGTHILLQGQSGEEKIYARQDKITTINNNDDEPLTYFAGVTDPENPAMILIGSSSDTSVVIRNIMIDGNSSQIGTDGFPTEGTRHLRVIYVGENGALTMEDGTTVTGGSLKNWIGYGAGIVVDEGSFIMNGGQVTGIYTSNHGAVKNDGGMFIMNGGTIEKNTASFNSSAIYTTGESAVTTIDGGIIQNNKTTGDSGTVSVAESATLNFISGKIKSNSVDNGGGGIYVDKSATLNMSGGEISSNTAAKVGGGISLNGGNATISGGIILSNNANDKGAGIYVSNGSSLIVEGNTEIRGNILAGTNSSLCHGGGIAASTSGSNSTVEIKGGLIVENQAPNGGGIAAGTDKVTIKISGGTIRDNKAVSFTYNEEDVGGYGGGLYIYPGNNRVTEITGGSIVSNEATVAGGGIYLSGNAPAINISGDTVIKENTVSEQNNNVYCGANVTPLRVTGTLGTFSEIWLNKGSLYSSTVIVNADESYNITQADFSKFNLTDDTLILYLDTTANAIKMTSDIATITFNSNMGEGTTTITQKAPSGYSTPLSANVFARDGYVFMGWNTAQDGTGTKYNDRAKITANANTVLYAQWAEIPKLATSNVQMFGETTLSLSSPGNAIITALSSEDTDVITINETAVTPVEDALNKSAEITATVSYSGYSFPVTFMVNVVPRVLTYTNKDDTPGSGSISYNYSGGHHALSDSLTFQWDDEPGTVVTLREGTDINYTYTVNDPEAPDGGTALSYDYLPMPVGSYDNVKFNLLNENYTFGLSDGSTRDYLEIDVEVVAEGSQRAYLASAAPKADQNFVYTGQGVLPVEGTLNAYTGDSTSSATVEIGTFTVNIEGLNGTSFHSEVSNIAAGTDLSAISGLALPTEPGTYIITASAANDSYYLYKSLVFTISKATVTVKAVDKSAYVGDAMPELTYTVSGLASGDSLTAEPTLTCNATDTNTAGTYTITPSGGEVNTAHYTLAYENGTLTVSTRSSGGGGSSSSNVSGSGDNVTITASGGSVTASQMESAVNKADEGATITIKATSSTTVSLPVGGMADAADNDNDVLLDLRYGEVTLTARTIAGLTDGVSSSGKIKVSITSQTSSKDETISGLLDKGAAVFDVSVTVNDVEVHSFDGTLTLTFTVSNLSKITDPHILHILTDGTKEYYAPDSISGNTITVKGVRNLSTFAVIPGSEVPEEQTNPFTDIYESDYYYDAVLWAVANGVTNGTSATTFGPNVTVTRAQMVTFLWRAHGSPEATGANPFTDVGTSDYYYDAVLWAVENGITVGTSDTTFSPETPVTRAQAVTFQWRAAGSPVVSGSSFDDVAADAYYVNAVTWAVANGITNGTSGTTFSPDVVVSRAQAVTFLWRELA